MNDVSTLPRHMLDIRELTAEAFAPYGQIIAPLRTGGQGAETGRAGRLCPDGFRRWISGASAGCRCGVLFSGRQVGRA